MELQKITNKLSTLSNYETVETGENHQTITAYFLAGQSETSPDRKRQFTLTYYKDSGEFTAYRANWTDVNIDFKLINGKTYKSMRGAMNFYRNIIG